MTQFVPYIYICIKPSKPPKNNRRKLRVQGTQNYRTRLFVQITPRNYKIAQNKTRTTSQTESQKPNSIKNNPNYSKKK